MYITAKIERNPSFLRKRYILLLLLFSVTSAWSQFELTVTPTDQTCPGNGMLAFSVENAGPGTITYTVYLLPDTENFIFNDSENLVEGLSAGNYLVIASQIVGGNTVTDEQEVTINDATTPLAYNLFSTPEFCGNDGKISVAVISGNPVTYEILSGPVTAAPQSISEFNNLPSGTYLIRVVDECGVGEVQSYQLFSEEVDLILSGPAFPDLALIECNLLTIQFTISASDTEIGIHYPLETEITVYPPDGSTPLVYNQTITSGDPAYCNTSAIIPFYYDTDFTVDLVVTDPCGEEYELLNMPAHQELLGIASFVNAECGMKFMEINVFKYGAPYTIIFTETPDDFDPELLCEDWPGPFTEYSTVYGDEENPVPWGTYEFEIHDACGRVAYASYENEPPEEDPEPETSASNHDCEEGLGSILIYIPNFDLETVIIGEAPPEYGDTPSDVSEHIVTEENNSDFGRFKMDDLPPGDYVFELIDTCGNTYTVEETIPEYEGEEPGEHPRPACDEGFGSIRVWGGAGIISIEITNAPAAFSTSFPIDVSSYINPDDEALYMTGLPPGEYTFVFSTACVGDHTVTSNVPAYEVTTNEAEVTRHCGSFDLFFNHQSNSFSGLFYCLQRYDPDLDQWVNPQTGLPVPAGEEPDDENSFELENNETAYNLNFIGEMRILKFFTTYGNGEPSIECMSSIYEFSFYDDLEITQLYNLTCVGTVADIEVTAIGVEPITYKIISKNNEPFVIDNGTDNIFEDLESAVYIIEVSDPCGNIEPLQFNIADLPSLVNAYDADDLEDCDTDGDGQQTFDLSVQDDDLLNGQDSTNVHLSYHDNLNDAEANTNQLPANYTASIGTKTLYGRVTSNADPECFDLESFDVTVNGAGSLTMETVWPACEGESVTVIADAGFVSYEWSNGAVTPSITVTESGTYTVTVTDENGCTITQDVEVVISSLPQIHHIEVSDWTDNSNVITVVMEESDSPENFEYSLDGIHYQESPIFTGLALGEYTIYVRDISGCGNDGAEAYLLSYPKFFTPNGDGINETWRIRYSMNEPDMLIYIFDRYGKLITGFGPNSPGWDGTLNGYKLPATDYWFVVKRNNGKEHKGHFSMIR